MPDLRDLKRMQAKRIIQSTAIALFSDRGYDSVTIEEIAADASVSPRTVYRYFGTKEALIVYDEFSHLTTTEIAGLIDIDDLVDSVCRMVSGFGADAPSKINLLFTVPAVRAAFYASIDEWGIQLSEVVGQKSGLPQAQSHVVANAVAFGYAAALEHWHRDGGRRAVVDYVRDALSPLAGLQLGPTDAN